LPLRTCAKKFRRRLDHQIDMSGEQILHRRAVAAIRHELKTRAGRVLKRNAGEMPGRAHAGYAHCRLVRVGFEPRNQALQIIRWQVLSGRDQQGLVGKLGHRSQIAQEIERQRVERPDQHVRGRGANAQRVAIGGRAYDAADADAAGRAGDIFDDNRLAKGHPHALSQNSRQDVGSSARGKWNDHGDGPRRIRVSPCRARHGCSARSTSELQELTASDIHDTAPRT
jgi:hypothetical protein